MTKCINTISRRSLVSQNGRTYKYTVYTKDNEQDTNSRLGASRPSCFPLRQGTNIRTNNKGVIFTNNSSDVARSSAVGGWLEVIKKKKKKWTFPEVRTSIWYINK